MRPPTLIIVGEGTLANEVARLAIAYGATVHAIRPGAEPGIDEPWTHGVAWHDADGAAVPESVPAGAMLWMSDTDFRDVRSDPRFSERFVVVREDSSVAFAATDDVIVATTGPIDDRALDLEGLDGDAASSAATTEKGSIRVERAAMALLRAAVDDDIPSQLDPADLGRLGDAMMWQ